MAKINQRVIPGRAYRHIDMPGDQWAVARSETHFKTGPDGCTAFYPTKEAAERAARES
jgi:hypothetical protein